MWKTFRKLVLVLAVILAFVGCRKDPIPACELERYGWITVVNRTTYDADVDVTWFSDDENYVVFLEHGDRFTYDEVPAGTVKIWITLDWVDWYYEVESLSPCEDMEFTWYLDAKKSTGCPVLLDIGNGELITPQRGEKR